MIKSLLTVALIVLTTAGNSAVPININYTDPAGYGFRDSTYGVQRRSAFETALRTWTDQLQGTVPLAVQARFEPMGGSAYSAVLAYAGPVSVVRDFPNAQPSTWYVTALANQLSGYDVDPGAADVDVVINADVDNPSVLGEIGFYYGLDGNSGNQIDFRTTILHELGHGLGFMSFISSATGDYFQAPGDATPLPDIYSRMLTKSKKGYLSSKTKPIDHLRAKQRLKALKSRQLRWSGPSAFARAGYMLPVYSPKQMEPGSSTSHWDAGNFPDLLMEPFDTGPKFGIDITRDALRDMGWKFI